MVFICSGWPDLVNPHSFECPSVSYWAEHEVLGLGWGQSLTDRVMETSSDERHSAFCVFPFCLCLCLPALRPTSWELTPASSSIPLQSAMALCRVSRALSADTPVHLARFRRGLLQEALVFQAEACSMRRWSSRYQHYVI